MPDGRKNHLPLSVLYTGAVKDLSGYAAAARDYVRSLDAVGVDVAVDARTFELQSRRLLEEVVERRMWEMMGKHPNAPIQVIHLTPDNYSDYINNGKQRIGYFAWETSRLPAAWVRPINDVCREVWVPCQYLADVSVSSGVQVPVRVLPHAVPLPRNNFKPSSSVAGLTNDRFKFYSIFQWCHDDQTRVLTKDGFKYFKDVSKFDWLATVNKSTGELEYQRPDGIAKYPYQGDLFRLNSKQFDFAVTPNHRLLVQHRNSSEWECVEAKDLLSKDGGVFSSMYKTLKHVSWIGEEPEFFYPPQPRQKRGRNLSVDKIPMEKFLRFFGWYLSEGCAQITERGYRIEITQVTSQDYIDEIYQSIVDIGFRPLKVPKGVIFYSKQMCLYLKLFGLAKEKFVPDWIKGLSPRLLTIFLESLFKGDGSSWDNGRWMKYATGSKQLAEDVLECLLKVGKCGAISSHESYSPHYPERRGVGYIISVSHEHLEPNLSYTPLIRDSYRGMVYCATVPNGTLVTERHGKLLISGNSERKNPINTLLPYYMEFDRGDPVIFVLKTYRVGNSASERDYIRREISRLKKITKGPNCPPVLLIEEFLSSREIQDIHYYCDCYVSMARSEGFGIPAFEAAAMGNTVIVPRYSAFPEYFSEDNSYLVDVPAEIPIANMKHISILYTGDMYWGDPSVDSCRVQLRHAFENRDIAVQKGIRARDYVKENLSYESIGRIMRGWLEPIQKELLSR